ncbi:MAG: NYN domain-containing protein [Novosphingobium sp.]|nr:NYN domain-containing protein [Novosphingobium sp.]
MAKPESRKNRNIALLIDADNASPNSLEAALTILGDLGTVNIRRVYGNWRKNGLSGWANLVHRHALEPQQQFDITKGKNATDMKIAIDAMDLLYSGNVDGFGIMSSDSDFMPVAMRIRQNGIPVYGLGSSKAPEGFREACTRFIDLNSLPEEDEGGKPTPAPAIDDQLVKLLGEAWKASKRDDQGYASLSEMGQRAANRSSFDARNYGFSRLSELVESLPNFATEKRGDGLFVRRVR